MRTPMSNVIALADDAVTRRPASAQAPQADSEVAGLTGFQHYGTLLEDGKENRAAFKSKLTMPVLVLNGDKGIPQAQTLGCVRQVAANIEAELVPNSGHLFAEDNPSWVAERLTRFFGPDREDKR